VKFLQERPDFPHVDEIFNTDADLAENDSFGVDFFIKKA